MPKKKSEKKRKSKQWTVKEFGEDPTKYYALLKTIPKKEQATFEATVVYQCKDRFSEILKEASNIVEFLHVIKDDPKKPAKLDRIYHRMVWKDPACKKAVKDIYAAQDRSRHCGKHALMDKEEIYKVLGKIAEIQVTGKWRGPAVDHIKAFTDPSYFDELKQSLYDAQNYVPVTAEKFEKFLRDKEKQVPQTV